MDANTERCKLAALKLMVTFVGLVAETEDLGPVPSGPIYAAMMAKGCSFELYTALTSSLVDLGWLKLSHNCFTTTQAGKDVLARSKAIA